MSVASPSRAPSAGKRAAIPRSEARRRHRWWLIGAGLVVSAAAMMEAVPEGRVAVSGFRDYPLPHVCMARRVLGVGCPGCGLTRSFIHLAHGRWSESLAAHRVGWILALAVVLQLPYRLAGLATGEAAPLGRRLPPSIGWLLAALLLANWCARALAAVY